MNETWNGEIDAKLMAHISHNFTTMNSDIISLKLYALITELISAAVMVISFSGVITNAINVKTFILIGIEDSVTVTFFSMSITDFLYNIVSAVQMGCIFLESFEKEHGIVFKVDPFALWFFCTNIGLVINVATTWMTTYLAVVRCLCVAKPLQFKTIFTQCRTKIVLVTLPVIAIASHMPLFSHMGMTSKFEPVSNSTRIVLWLSSDRDRVKDVTRMIFFFYGRFITLAILLLCIIVMTVKLQKSAQFRRKNTAGGQQTRDKAQSLSNKEMNVVKQIVVIGIVSILSGVFYIVTTLFTSLDPDLAVGKPKELLYLLLSNAVIPFDTINSSVNFYIYYTFNSKFRLLCTTWQRRGAKEKLRDSHNG